MRSRFSLFALMLLGGLTTSVAHADIAVSLGNMSGGNNVAFTNNPADGTTIKGVLNQGSVYDVNFSSTQMLHGNGGQASVGVVGGADLTNISVSLNAGLGFTQYVGNAFSAPKNSTLTVTVQSVNSLGVLEAPTVQNLSVGNGQNFFTVQASNGERITSVALSGVAFTDLRQNRIAGVQSLSASAVPEPGSVALLVGMGASGSVFALRKRRVHK